MVNYDGLVLIFEEAAKGKSDKAIAMELNIRNSKMWRMQQHFTRLQESWSCQDGLQW